MDEAAQLLAKARLMSENTPDIALTEYQLAEARGYSAAAQQALDELRQIADQDQKVLDYGVVFFYPMFLTGKNGTGMIAVPGLVPEMIYSTNGIH